MDCNNFRKLKIKKFSISGLFILFFVFFVGDFVLAAPKVTVTPTTQTIRAGQKAVVKIVTVQATKCTVSGGTYNKNNTLINGSILLSPTQTTTYIFECTDSTGQATNTSVGVTVTGTTATTGTQPTNATSNPTTGQNNQNTTKAPQIQYSNDTIATEANNICTTYSGYKSVYNPVSGVGGGSSVPVDLTQLREYLISIDRNSQLTANELRNANLIRFCRELPNMAAASNKLAQDTAKQLKKMADECIGDEKCYLKRVYDSDLQREIEYAQKLPAEGNTVAKLILFTTQNKSVPGDNFDYQQINYCNGEFDKGNFPMDCSNLTGYTEDVIKTNVRSGVDRIYARQNSLSQEFFQYGGLTSSRPCIETRSGTDPSQVPWYDKDCADYKKQPIAVTQEVLRQVTALPFTQAYSPANVLGADQSIDNINTRIRNGNLIDTDISSNFGSIAGGGTNPLGSGGGVVPATNLKDAEANYTKILSNIQVITTLYDVAKAAYASSTNVCKNIPVQTRTLTINRVENAKKTYTDYATALTTKWEDAKKKPNENHLTLVTNINFDLKDKYNQTLITQVYDAVKALLQTCADASKPTS